MPRRTGPNTEAMIRAAEGGAQLAQRASEERTRETDITGETARRGIEGAAATVTELDEKAKDRQARKEEIQAEIASREKISGQELEQRKIERDEQRRQYEEQTDVDLAKHGLQRTQPGAAQDQEPGPGQPGSQQQGPPAPEQYGPPSPEQQRAAAQMGKPIEGAATGQPRFMPTRAAAEMAAQKGELAQARQELAQEREARRRGELTDKYRAAQLKQDEVELDKAKEGLLAPIRADQKLRDDILSGKIMPDDSRLADLMTQATGHPISKADLNTPEGMASAQQFLKNRIAFQQLMFIGETGDMPADKNLVMDTTSPVWAEFQQAQMSMNQLAADSGIASFINVQSSVQKMRLINKAAVRKMWADRATQMQANKAIQPRGASNVQPQRPTGGAGRTAAAGGGAQRGLTESGGYGLR